jgi:photosystem II stability/assembly factor-like uncharacterized protein
MSRFEKISCITILFTTALILFAAQNTMSQWIPQIVPVDKPIAEVEFVDENTGWAVTGRFSSSDTAYILKTIDGGSNWNIEFSANFTFYCLDVINDQIAYAGGSGGGIPRFYKTINGGMNWIDMNISVLVLVTDMFFVNADSGYIIDEFFGGLKMTTDGGVSWINREDGLMVNGEPRTLFFLNSDTGFCGGSNKIFKTSNAGLNWFLLYTFESPTLGNRPSAIQFLDNETGFVSLNNNTVGSTTNGGLNWNVVNPYHLNLGDVRDIDFVNELTGWAGPQGVGYIFKSSNGGGNWVVQDNPSGSSTIHMSDSLLGWSGRVGISKTTNGGLMFISGIGSEVPSGYKLYQNYPNPFNPVTVIRFEIFRLSEIKLNVFNILGQKVATLLDQRLSPGVYEFTWDASDLSSGIYFYTLETEGFKDTKKLVLLK